MSGCAASSRGHHHVGQIAYALYGRAHSERLQAWNKTWLEGKPYVFVPDAPSGPFARLFRPAHRPADKGTTALFRFPTDANMLWAAFAANQSFPDASWVFVVDDDTMPFEHTLRSVARRFDASQSVAIGWTKSAKQVLVTSRPHNSCVATSRMCKDHGEYGNDDPGCCICPVVETSQQAWRFDSVNGRAHYRTPSVPPFYGGTGILLSRGLLDAIPSHAWALCAERLVCGPSDLRLSTCIANLAPTVCWVPVRENALFMSSALDKPDDPEAGSNIWINELWSSMSADPLRGPRILERFRNGSAALRCPWSMHKLDLTCVPAVFHASQHCHTLRRIPSARPHEMEKAAPPCWIDEERRERHRLRREFGWKDASTAPFEELFAREQRVTSIRDRAPSA